MEPAGVEVPIIWRGRRAKAFVPELLAHRDLALSDDPDLAHFLDPFKKSLVSAVENFGLVHAGPERTPPR